MKDCNGYFVEYFLLLLFDNKSALLRSRRNVIFPRQRLTAVMGNQIVTDISIQAQEYR